MPCTCSWTTPYWHGGPTAKGTFESDDEVGFFFQELKELNSILNNLFTQEVDDATIKEEEKKEE